MSISPTQRSLQHLRSRGYLVAVTEHWNPFAKVRQDLYGFVDVLALHDGKTLAIQTTSASNFSSRKKKILEHENLPMLIAAGWQVVIHGWRKNSKNQWVLREELISETLLFETTQNQ